VAFFVFATSAISLAELDFVEWGKENCKVLGFDPNDTNNAMGQNMLGVFCVCVSHVCSAFCRTACSHAEPHTHTLHMQTPVHTHARTHTHTNTHTHVMN
jgi:hypothetical protein